VSSTYCDSNLERLLADPLVGLMMRADRVDPLALGAKFKAIARRLEDKERGFSHFPPPTARQPASRFALLCAGSGRTEPADRRDMRAQELRSQDLRSKICRGG
jgi:hypothetical protein